MHPHNIRDASLAFELNAENMLEGLPPLSPEDTASVISNKNVKFGLLWP